MKPFRRILVSLALVLPVALPVAATAHEFWLEPETYQARPGDAIPIELRNGEDFAGITLSWFDRRIASAQVFEDGKWREYEGLPGDLPAITLTAPEGLASVAYASTLSKLTYDSWEKTLSFARHKDFPWFEKTHANRGLPPEKVTEGYWRFSKTLVAGGDGAGADAVSGMETEFVAVSNPFTDPGPLRARLLYQGEPRADVQVEVWEKAADDTVTKVLLRTDGDGVVSVPTRPGHSYMLDAVVLREPASEAAVDAGVMWESLWANLTFAVPQ